MTSTFLFALIVGGGLLAISLLGDLFGGDADVGTAVGADLDAELDVDLDADLDALDPDGDAWDGAHAMADSTPDVVSAIRIFTIRNLTYFLFGYGAVGWILSTMRPELAVWVVAAAAVGGGVMAAGTAAVVFGWLRATDAGWQASEESWVGCEGRVVLPLGHGRVGQIIVRRGDREHELRALPFDGRAAQPEEWRTVVVIEMDGETARVSPMEALATAASGRADT